MPFNRKERRAQRSDCDIVFVLFAIFAEKFGLFAFGGGSAAPGSLRLDLPAPHE
jgi:hypothetical protein